MTDIRILGRMPPCLGHHEAGDPECEGKPSRGADADEALPCLFRDRCVAFALLVKETRKSISDFVVTRELVHGSCLGVFTFPMRADFLADLDERVVRHDISSGTLLNRSGVLVTKRRKRCRRGRKLGPQSRAHRQKLGRVMRRRLVLLRWELEALGWQHLGLIAERLRRPLHAEEIGTRPEELFLVDHLADRRFGALYYRLRRFRRKFSQRPVVRFYPRIAAGWAGSVELQIACPFAAFRDLIPRRDVRRIMAVKREQFDSFGVVVRHVSILQASIIAEVVEKLASRGHFGFGQ